MPNSETKTPFDLLIIGGGPAGGAAAETALQLGKKIALVERDQLGGT
jgi:dihydrolipoamide dehydrogenase